MKTRAIARTIIGFLSLFIMLSGSALAATLAGGRIVDLKDGSQLIFDISEAIAPETFLLADPPRYVIDLPNAAAQGLNLNLSSRDVRNVRAGSPNGRDLRIVVDLNAAIRGKASIVKDQGHRLVIDLFRNEPAQAINTQTTKPKPTTPPLQLISKAQSSSLPKLELVSKADFTKTKSAPSRPSNATTATTATTRPTAKVQTPTASASRSTTKPASSTPKPTSNPNISVATSATPTAKPTTNSTAKPAPNAKPITPKAAPTPSVSIPAAPKTKPATKTQRKKRNILIAIDPGHGGKDTGAVGPSGTREKDVVLQIAKRLQKTINQEPGMSAFLTRNGDTYLKLHRRIAIARSKKADIFVSIHAVAYFNAKPQGASVFMLSTKGASSTMARWLAESENKSDLIDNDLDIADKQVRQIVFEMVHDAVLADSKLMADKVLGQLRQVGKLHSHKAERANFAVLKSPDIPSILVETAFISNPSEERKLRSSSYQNELANAILKGIKGYVEKRPLLGVELVEVSANNQRHLVRSGDTVHSIATRYNVSIEQLISANGLNRRNPQLDVGDKLRIPQGG